MVWMAVISAQSQEFDFYSISPTPSLSMMDSVLNPFTRAVQEPGKSGITLRDSLYFFAWNSIDSLWERVSSSHYTYDGQNNRTYSLTRNWVSDSWENSQLREYFYDEKGNRFKEVENNWNDGEQQWENTRQKMFYYNEYHNLTSYVVQNWNEIQLSWNNSAKYLYDYDSQQNWTYWEKQTWNSDSLKWISSLRFLWVYQEGVLTTFTRQTWNSSDSSWIKKEMSDYFYNPTNDLTEERQSIWQGVDSTWQEKTIIRYTYNLEGEVTEKFYQSWDEGILKDLALYTYGYSGPGQVSEIVYFSRNSTDWDTTYRYLFDYDEFGTLIRETDQQWNSGNEDWLNEYKWEYYSTHFFDPLEAFISDSTNVSCFDYSNGTATVTISGGNPPYTVLWNDPQNTTDLTVFGLSANQYYTVTVTDAALNSVSDSVLLSQPPKIITGQIYGVDIVDQNDTATYWVESDTSSIYSWFVVNGQILFQQGSDTIVVVWTGSGQGEVSVIESTINGCEGDTVRMVISISSTFIRENPFPNLLVYPNPASQVVYIQFDEGENRSWDIEIYDMTGKLAQSVLSLMKTRVQIPLDNIRRGVYFFKIANSSGAVIRKVVVER